MDFEEKLTDLSGLLEKDYYELYPGRKDALERLYILMKKHHSNRSDALKSRDKSGSDWLYSPDTVGIMLYVNLFSNNLLKLIEHSEYFKKLGITLIHLMPILKPRTGENDGGYAVQDYRAIDSRIGTMKDFKKMVEHYHANGIRICIDYVVNHTSDDHEWAKKALSGDEKYQKYYFVFDNDAIPKQFEASLHEVFPKVAPGNFTYLDELGKWVMTTFYPFQWDLNFRNPEVFYEMVDNLLYLTDIGVDMIRLDAIPYIWKTIGTDCKNLPEVHLLLGLFRKIVELCAPSTTLLGEAIVEPDTIVKYFGKNERLECHSLYNASYMVEIWNSIATRDARHISWMKEYDIPETSVWINYARCHDDIGWGLDSERLQRMGFDPNAHKSFLIDFYLGSLEDSFSSGELYEFNPMTMDARNSGTLASLAGLEKAIKLSDDYLLELALKRIRLIHALFLFRRGIPMLYSGDEIGQLNNLSYLEDDHKKNDSRWLHRMAFDWEHVSESRSIDSVHSQVHKFVKQLIETRRTYTGDAAVVDEKVVRQSNDHLLVIRQTTEKNESIILIFNLSEDRQWLYTNELKRHGLCGIWRETIQGKAVDLEKNRIILGPYEFFVTKM